MRRFFIVPAVAVLLASPGFSADVTIGAALGRPATLHVPASYDESVPAPLIVFLHGYSGTGLGNANWLGFPLLSDELGFLLTYPNGLRDGSGNLTWTNSGFTPANSAYLRGLIEEVLATFNVNPNRVYITGYSDGGFMSYQMACEHPDLVAAVASGAGRNRTACAATRVHLLEIHGTGDTVVSYASGRSSWEAWADGNGCTTGPEEVPATLDLVTGAPVPDTTIERYPRECTEGIEVELWSIEGAIHVPTWTTSGGATNYGRNVVDWLLRHGREPCVEPALAVAPESGPAPFEVAFDASASLVPEGMSIVSYEWDFGDGAVLEDTEPLATHTYDRCGWFEAMLLIRTDDVYCVARASHVVTVSCPCDDLSPWTPLDVGEPAFAGGTAADGDCLSLCAGGSGFSAHSDQFHYVFQELSGDFVLVAQVSELACDRVGAEAGLMFRESLDPEARFAAMTVQKASAMRPRFAYRLEDGRLPRSEVGEDVELPVWVRLERRGETLVGYSSPDGSAWAELHRRDYPGLPETIFGGLAAADRIPGEVGGTYVPLQARACALEALRSEFVRGDANCDGELDIADGIFVVSYLFLVGRPPECLDSADANDSGNIDLGDATSVFGHLFGNDGPLAAPETACGVDPTPDTLDCRGYEPCR